ncbi:MAG TPA: hypothetical protein VGM98_00645 [Schlesneria sp.]|jgi:hypothetical protein
MRTFFRDWRRKVGCVTLAIACVFTAAWWRSLETFDEFEYRIGDTIYAVRSAQGGASLATDQILSEDAERHYRLWTSMLIEPACTQIDPNFVESPKRGFESLGFYFGGNPEVDTTCAVPYWAVVLLMTLLSAYLIVWKPHPRSIGS